MKKKPSHPDDQSPLLLLHGHRERTKEKILKTDLSSFDDYEILEALLMYSIPRKDVKLLAKQLLAEFYTLGNVLCAEAEQLYRFKYIKENTIVLFKLIRAAHATILRRDLINQPILGNRAKIMDYCYSTLGREKKESFHILFLDAKLHLLLDQKMGEGTINKVPLYPREIIHKALELGAKSMVLIHNHPSGDARPSIQDIKTTQQLKDVAVSLSIELSDHIIISRTGATSLKMEGHLK